MIMFKWLDNRSLSSEDRVKIACTIYNRNDPSKLHLPKWLSEEIVSLHNTKPRPHVILANLWRLLAACLQDRQPTLNHLPLIHVAKEEITCNSRAIDDVLICLEKFPDTLLRRYDVLIELLGPMIECSIKRINDHSQTPLLINLLNNLLKKFLYCQRNHGNQKKVFKQFCDNLLWACLQLRCLCVRLEMQEDLLVLVDKLLTSLFHRNHLVGYDSGLGALTASSSYTRHLFESLSTNIANCDESDDEVIASGLPYLFRVFLEQNRKANNAVKKNTEFRFFQWLLSQLGVSEDQSGLLVVVEAKVEAIHQCLCILLELDVVEPSSDKSSGGSQLRWLEMLARGLVDTLSHLTPPVVNCLSILLTIYHPIVEPLLPSLLCRLAQVTDNDLMMKLISVYAKLRQLKKFLCMQLESIKSSHEQMTAVYSNPVALHLADHLKHLPTGQVTEIIEMFNACLHDSLPSVTADNDISDVPLRKKKKKLQDNKLILYQTVDLFCLVLDHVPLVGINLNKLIHQQLYHDIVLPLLGSLFSLQPCLVRCSLHLAVSCTRLLGCGQLLTNDVLSVVDLHSACQGSNESFTDEPSLLLLKQLVSLHVRFGTVEQDDVSELLSFILQPPTIHQSLWDGQWLNVTSDNVTVANWKLITSELPYLYSLCSDGHLHGIVEVILDVLASSQDQTDDHRLSFVSITVDFMTSCTFQEMGLFHTLLLQCILQKVQLASTKLPKLVRKTLATLPKMLLQFEGVKFASQLTTVLSDTVGDDFDVDQLALWNKNTVYVMEIFKYLPVTRMSADHLVVCIVLIVVWTFMASRCPSTYDQGLKYTLLLAWLLRTIKDHPHRKKYLVAFPFLAVQGWLCSLLLDEKNYSNVVWPACKALLECAASCDPPVMSSVIVMCTQLISQHPIGSHAFNVITEIANTSLNAVLRYTKQPLPETFQQEISEFCHVIQKVIRKACKRKFVTILSSPVLISLYVTTTSVVPEDSVDTSLSSNLLEGVEDVLQADNITQTDDDELTVSKKYCSVVEILTLALKRGHSLMAVWRTGSQLWQSLINSPMLSASAVVYSKLNDAMSKLVASCSTEDAKVMFESLLSAEISSYLLFIKQWQLILTSKMSTETRKMLNHYLSQLICKCMEVLAVDDGLSEVSHNTMSLVTKVLTICTERDTRSVMLTLHGCVSPQHYQEHCLKCMELCIGVLSTILRYHLNTAISCAPVLFTAVNKLLVDIIEVAHARQADDSLDEITNVANHLCRVIELMSAEVKFTKFVPHLIATYLLQAGGERGGEIPDIIKETLLSGVHLLLRLCTEHETSFLNATLDECSRELFKAILSDYHKFHKYKGKV